MVSPFPADTDMESRESLQIGKVMGIGSHILTESKEPSEI